MLVSTWPKSVISSYIDIIVEYLSGSDDVYPLTDTTTYMVPNNEATPASEGLPNLVSVVVANTVRICY